MESGSRLSISDGEWKIMNLLWERAPRTIMELTHELSAETGWGKNTVITMLNRLEAKGAVRHREGERARQYYAAVDKADIATEETRGFLDRVYDGSVSLLVDAMASTKALSKKDIEELYEILRKAEESV